MQVGDGENASKSPAMRWLRFVVGALVAVFSVARLVHLKADFPDWSPWLIDQAKFTDEGWWAYAAVIHHLSGHWYVQGDYNPAVALPVWPMLMAILFHFTGVSIMAARAFNVLVSIATLGVVFVLVRRHTNGRSEIPALLAVLLLAASPFAFAFSRLAILDTLVVFEFCLALLLASMATERRWGPLVILPVLLIAMLLTKTTAAMLFPAVLWMAWCSMGRKPWALLRVALAVGVVPLGLQKGYAVLVSALGYGADYRYFFDFNAMPDIAWAQAPATLWELAKNGFMIDRLLYPASLLILVASLAWKRKLWTNPLFAASWLVVIAQVVFIFSRQDDFAPRYLLVVLAPLIWIVVLAYDHFSVQAKGAAAVLLAVIGAAVVVNGIMIGQFLARPTYHLYDAAQSIRTIITADPVQKPLMLGVSGAQISLMTGIPSINDGLGTEDIPEKVARYKPGWYLTWNGIAPENDTYLSPYRMEKMGSYRVFDDDDRNVLELYKMVPR